ncbi:SAM-dependent methyltransferase [Stackebrandtia sp.]|jgi:SAM-dependent MidA family methyltransferase|uniref:SAM-dependent methyltransferase n=1 Tax=Stackebrandtia sp. TaxID=2023065 RepID=UPI0039C974C6
MAHALYGPEGFYTANRPDAHYRTSAQSPLFAEAIAELVRRIDSRLGRPERFDLVDVGAGAGELLGGVLGRETLDGRLAPVAVELRPRPADLDERIAWVTAKGGSRGRFGRSRVVGLLVACELLDNVPCDVAVRDDAGVDRHELVDPATGDTRPGEALSGMDSAWLRRWWPLSEPGSRAEIGRTRDAAWRRLCALVRSGTALAIDYGHTRDGRPALGTLTGFAAGRQVPPIPDGDRDITAHVALDSLGPGRLTTQGEALRALGMTARRPPLDLAVSDPARYLRALARVGEAAALTDPVGLGGHYWLFRGD